MKSVKPVSMTDGRRKNNLTAEQRARVSRAGGLASSKDRSRMAEIGRRGGLVVSVDRGFMAEIGRKGGKAGLGTPKVRTGAEDLKP